MIAEKSLSDSIHALENTSPAQMLETMLKHLRTERAKGELRDHVHVGPVGPQPIKHNHYYDDRFFQHDAQNGMVRNVYGQRIIRMSEDFIVSLFGGLEEVVGDAAGEILYKAGFLWGLEDMAGFVPRVQTEFEVAFEKLNMGFMLETWWWPLQIEGWGTWRYDFRQHKQGLIFIDLYEAAVAKSLGEVGKVVCHFYAGLFAATFSVLAKRELSCTEIQCSSTDGDACRFLISTSKRVNAAASWRNEGASSMEIQQKLLEM